MRQLRRGQGCLRQARAACVEGCMCEWRAACVEGCCMQGCMCGGLSSAELHVWRAE